MKSAVMPSINETNGGEIGNMVEAHRDPSTKRMRLSQTQSIKSEAIFFYR